MITITGETMFVNCRVVYWEYRILNGTNLLLTVPMLWRHWNIYVCMYLWSNTWVRNAYVCHSIIYTYSIVYQWTIYRYIIDSLIVAWFIQRYAYVTHSTGACYESSEVHKIIVHSRSIVYDDTLLYVNVSNKHLLFMEFKQSRNV